MLEVQVQDGRIYNYVDIITYIQRKCRVEVTSVGLAHARPIIRAQVVHMSAPESRECSTDCLTGALYRTCPCWTCMTLESVVGMSRLACHYYHKHNSISRFIINNIIITQVKEIRYMHLVMAGGRHRAVFSKVTELCDTDHQCTCVILKLCVLQLLQSSGQSQLPI